MMRIQSWRTVLISAMLALLFIYVSWWAQMINNPNERSSTDFMAFYAAGRVAQAHGISAVYDIDRQQVVEEEVVGFELGEGQVLLYNHLPYFVPVLALVVDDDYAGSFIRWVLLLAIVFFIATYFLINALFANTAVETRLMLAGGMITFLPLFISIWQGQDTAFLYLGMALWCAGMLKKQDLPAALGLALVTVRPHICIALALPLLFKYRQVLWRFVALAGITALYSLLIVGVDGISNFIYLLSVSAKGEWFGMQPEAMLNLLGLMLRGVTFLDHGTINTLGWIVFGIGLVIITVMWIRSQTCDQRLLGLTVLIAAIFAPHLHIHDLTILIFPLLFAITDDTRRISPQMIAVLFGASFVFITGLVVEPLYFILPYGIYIALTWRLATGNIAGHKH